MNIEDSAIFRSIMKKYESNKDKVSSSLIKIKTVLATETKETSDMLDIYSKYVSGEKLDKKAIDQANQQFADLIKNVGFLGVFALPGGLLAIFFLVKLGKKLGIDILPKNFKDWTKYCRLFFVFLFLILMMEIRKQQIGLQTGKIYLIQKHSKDMLQ